MKEGRNFAGFLLPLTSTSMLLYAVREREFRDAFAEEQIRTSRDSKTYTCVQHLRETERDSILYCIRRRSKAAEFTLFTFDSRAYILLYTATVHMHVSLLSALRCVTYVWVHKCTHQRYIYVIYTYEVGLYPLYYLISHFRALYLSCRDNSVVTPSGLFCRTFTLYTFCIIYIRPRFICSYYIHICTRLHA